MYVAENRLRRQPGYISDGVRFEREGLAPITAQARQRALWAPPEGALSPRPAWRLHSDCQPRRFSLARAGRAAAVSPVELMPAAAVYGVGAARSPPALARPAPVATHQAAATGPTRARSRPTPSLPERVK